MNDKPNAKIFSCDPVDDGPLVLAAKRGDEQAFEILVTRYQSKIFAIALRYVIVPEDAEDLVQETFQKAFIHLHGFEGKSSFSTWLTRIAINEALMLLRRDRARREVSLEAISDEHTTASSMEIPDFEPDPEMHYLQRETVEALFMAMSMLAPRLRAALKLRELGELSTRETAQRIGVSVGAVKSRVFQGRAKLRNKLRHLRAAPNDARQLNAASAANRPCSSFHLQSR